MASKRDAYVIIAAVDFLAVLVVYEKTIKRVQEHLAGASYCSSLPYGEIANQALRPHYWFALISGLIIVTLVMLAIGFSAIRLWFNRYRLSPWLIIVGVALFFLAAAAWRCGG
jgi:hypothetical protein